MLSRLAHSAGRVAPAVNSNFQIGNVLVVSAARTSATQPEVKQQMDLTFRKKIEFNPTKVTTPQEHMDNWDKANAIFYGPDRDYKNFPILKRPRTHPPVRFAHIPESWFQFFYPKTGVTGPYMFVGGLATFLLSKEIWVVEHGFTDFVCFWSLVIILYNNKRVMNRINKFFENQMAINDKIWDDRIETAKTEQKKEIEKSKQTMFEMEGRKYIYEAKRENVDFQLEEEYRKRQMEVYKAIKSRMDYLVASENAKRRFEQNHMVNWIVDNVVKGITPKQEKESISKCIADLKALAQKSPGAALS